MNPEELADVIKFHGHFCPGLAIGFRAAQLALSEIGAHAADEEIVSIVETDMCGVDAIQFMTGCTFGKGNLIHLDYGKSAFTFIRRSDGKAIRLLMHPQPKPNPAPQKPNNTAQSETEKAQERKQQQELFRQRALAILDMPIEELFEIQPLEPNIPKKARVRESIQCDSCGEMAMETRIRLIGGQKLCIPCFEKNERRL